VWGIRVRRGSARTTSGRRVSLVLVAAITCACEATPAPTALPSPTDTPAVSSPDVDPADLAYWIAFRNSFGIRADRDWVLFVATMPAAANDTGVPLLPSELVAVGNRLRQQRDITEALML
jgi:hypothetical protein